MIYFLHKYINKVSIICKLWIYFIFWRRYTMISLENLSSIEKEMFQNSIKLIMKLFSESRKEEVVDTYLGKPITKIVLKDEPTDIE